MLRFSRLTVLLALLGSLNMLHASPLKAGIAKVDITPPVGTEMWGFAVRTTPAIGTIDPLYARVLVLDSDARRIAIVALDLGRCFGPDSVARLQKEARENSGVSLVLASASHTHAGPVISDHYPKGTPEWELQALTKIGQAIHQATTNMVDVRLAAGYGMTYIGYNRLESTHQGFNFNNRTDRPISSPYDPTVAVLRVDTMDGKPLAILVNYACHAVIFGAENLKFSADFPAAMSKTVEGAFDSAPMTMFLQGGPGDIDPYYANMPNQQEPDKWRNWTGQTLGEEAARVAKSIDTKSLQADGSLDFIAETINFRMRWNPDKFYDSYVRTWGAGHADNYFPGPATTVAAPVSTILINKQIAFAVLPGEAFVEFQTAWRSRCPVHYSFFVGYTNAYVGYFPTIQAAVKGGYGGATGATWVEVGAGERLVNNAVIEVYRLLGQLSDAPE